MAGGFGQRALSGIALARVEARPPRCCSSPSGADTGVGGVAAKQRSSWGEARGPARRPTDTDRAIPRAGIEQDTRLDPLASRSGSGAAGGSGRMRASVSYGRRLAGALTSDRQLEPCQVQVFAGRRHVARRASGGEDGYPRADRFPLRPSSSSARSQPPPPRARSPSAGTLGGPVPACQGGSGNMKKDLVAT